jgi:lipid A 3-O-deacylase
MLRPVFIGLVALAVSVPAEAGEVFGGVFVHDVDTPLTYSGVEGGADIQLGYRAGPLTGLLGLQPYAFVSVNTSGETHYAAAGLSYKIGDKVFIRPGLGIAVHTGSSGDVDHVGHDHIDFGSRILFEPELGVGFKVSERMTLEASWVHMSHATLLSRQNPGIDNFGARLSWKF